MITILHFTFVTLCIILPIVLLAACAISSWKKESIKHRREWRDVMISRLRHDLRHTIPDDKFFEEKNKFKPEAIPEPYICPDCHRAGFAVWRESVPAKTMYIEDHNHIP